MNEENKKLIVSLTSYPARIEFVPETIGTLLNQTRPADQIVLYLSADQFPGREEDLPEALREGQRDEHVTLRWVSGDLKPHKKYFYAFREFPEDIVMTVDDDVCYPPELLEKFWETHLEYPGAVVGGRTHLITLNEEGEANPYSLWLQRTAGFAEGPSHQLLAVGVGGTLYDPSLFPKEMFDEEAIRETCLEADDLWLKAWELIAGIPVVHSTTPELVRFVPGSQTVSLYKKNINQNHNDIAIAAIREWVIRTFGRDVLKERLNDEAWPRFPAGDPMLLYLNLDRKRTLETVNDAYNRMNYRLNKENTQLRTNLEKKKEEIRTKNEEIRRKNSDIEHKKAEIERKTDELARRKADVERLKVWHDRDLERLEKARRTEEKQEIDLTRLTKDVAKLREDNQMLKNSLSYRLGNILIRPVTVVRRLVKGKGGKS